MNTKGFSIMTGIVLLVTAVIGVVLVDSVNAPLWQTTFHDQEAVANPAANGTAYTLSYCYDSGAVLYDWTNATTVPSYQYTIATNTLTLGTPIDATNVTGTNITLNYTSHDCSSYLQDSTSRTVMEYFIIIVGVVTLALAGAWLYFKG